MTREHETLLADFLRDRESDTHAAMADAQADAIRSALATIRELRDAIIEADRLLSVCEFTAPEDVAGFEMVSAAAERAAREEK